MKREKSIDCLPLCEEAFLAGSFDTALRYATTIRLSNPGVSEPATHLAAYDIHVKATSQRTINGEIDWYAVIGVDPTASEDQIMDRYAELKELLFAGHVKMFAALCGARRLVEKAMSVLGDPERKVEYDERRRRRD